MSGGRLARAAAPAAVALAVTSCLSACGSSHRPAQTSTTTAASSSTAAPTTASSSPKSACSNLKVIQRWSLARRAALVVAAPVLDFNATALRVAASAGTGGVVFLGNAPPTRDLAERIASAHPGAAPTWLVMADEEGGGVQRLAGAVLSLPWPRDAAATMTPGQVEQQAHTAGIQMRAIRVNVDLAPVLDLDARPGPSATNPDGYRSYSADPAVATRYGLAFARGLESAGILSVVKHFPGLGGSSGNTDVGPAATHPLVDLEKTDLLPFRAAVEAGLPAVMISNASVPGLTGLPSSLSRAVIGGLLRTNMGFKGLVLTDSLSAGAVTSAGYDLPRAATAAIEAGADLVLFGSTLTAAQTALLSPTQVGHSIRQIVTALLSAVARGALPTTRLDGAVLDVLAAGHTDLCHGSGT